MATTTHMTLAEFEALPDEPGKQELLKGELICVPPPKFRHSRLQKRVAALLDEYGRQHGGGEAYIDTGFRLSENTCLIPDVAFVREAQITEADPDGWLQGAPALAVEILSPSNRASDMDDKVQAYLEAGADAVWVVNPKRQKVTAYRRDGHFEASEMPDGELAGEPALPGLRIRLSALFA